MCQLRESSNQRKRRWNSAYLSLSLIFVYIYINIYIPVHMEILLPLPLLDWQDGANKPEEGQPSAAQAP